MAERDSRRWAVYTSDLDPNRSPPATSTPKRTKTPIGAMRTPRRFKRIPRRSRMRGWPFGHVALRPWPVVPKAHRGLLAGIKTRNSGTVRGDPKGPFLPRIAGRGPECQTRLRPQFGGIMSPNREGAVSSQRDVVCHQRGASGNGHAMAVRMNLEHTSLATWLMMTNTSGNMTY